jgi:dolichol-phosphate mannosyltransferase
MESTHKSSLLRLATCTIAVSRAYRHQTGAISLIDPRNTGQSGQSVELTVMIPAYREGAALKDLLPKIKEAASTLTQLYEILIVDTQQPMDNTAEVCAAHDVRHIFRSGGNSYGDAIRSGIEQAQGRYLLCMDADGSHNPIYFASMWDKRDEWDIVIGSRYAPGGHTENPAILIGMSYLLNLTFRIAFNITAKDVTNSFRLYNRAVLVPLRLESNDFDILEELLIKAATCHPPARIGEVPVTFERRKAGESKRKLVQFAFGYISTLQKLRKFQKDAQREQAQKRSAQ